MKTKNKHWLHDRFEHNLTQASGGQPLAQCARHWKVERVARTTTALNCQVCNTRMNNYLVLRNEQNDNRILVGTDCYDKLQHFLVTGKVESVLLKYRDHIGGLRKYTGALMDKTVRGWLFDAATMGKMPENIRQAVSFIEQHGFAASKEDADMVVEYYKSTRRFDLLVLVPEARYFRYDGWMPKTITISEIERVRRILAKARVLDSRFSERKAHLRVVHDAVVAYLPHFESFLKAATAKRMDLITAEFSKILLELREASTASVNRLPSIKSLPERALTWWKENYFKIWPRTKVVISGGSNSGNQVGIWIRDHWLVINVEFLGGRPSVPGMYHAYVDPAGMDKIRIDSEPIEERFDRIHLNVPSRSNDGTFIGKLQGKIALPQNRVTRKGIYRYVLFEEKPNFLRVYTF